MERKAKAQQIAQEVQDFLARHGYRSMVVGSLRHGSAIPKDIDILVKADSISDVAECGIILRGEFGKQASLIESHDDGEYYMLTDRLDLEMTVDLFFTAIDYHWFPPQIFRFEEREESLSHLAEVTNIPYNTLARYAREGRIVARKSGGVWLSTLSAVKAAEIKARS